MNHPIKFRAWDGEKMHKAFDLTQNPLYWWQDNYDYPLMQYTGLKDKNGVEIYEGDVLRYVPPDEYGEDERPDLYEVEWKDYGFEARWANPPTPKATSDGHLSLKGADEDMEVIGNNYEDPGLLTEAVV